MASPAAKRRKLDPNSAQINEGYDIGLFINSNEANHYLCVICQCVFKQPYNIGCCNEHLFCKGCLDNYFIPINSPKACPSCRSNGLLKSKIKPSLFVERVVNSLQVQCKLQLEQNENDYQCVWSGELRDLEQHINIQCPLTNVICNYCNQNMRRYQLTEHENICIEKPIGCDECGQEIKRRLLQRHQDYKCPMKILSCDDCKENVLRKDMKRHILTICPEYEIMCSFQQYGCNAVIKRTLMEQHLEDNEMKHLKMKVNVIENELKKIKQKNNLEITDMSWSEYFSERPQKDTSNDKQCIISYMNGHDIIYENNGNNIYVNVFDMGMKTLLKRKKIYKDTQFKDIFKNWTDEFDIRMDNLMVYNYTERKNKTLRPNKEIKLDVCFKYAKIGDVLENKKMFILFDRTKVEYLGRQCANNNGGKTILIALKYFDIFEQELYFVDWLLVKTKNITFKDVMDYIEIKLSIQTKDKRRYFDVFYDYCKQMNDWERKTGKTNQKFVVFEEEVVLKNNECKVSELGLDNSISDEYFDGDMFIFQLNTNHPYFDALKIRTHIGNIDSKNNSNFKISSLKFTSVKNKFEERGIYWFNNVCKFLKSQLNMTWIELKIRENTGWETRWTHALILQYKNDNNMDIKENINEEIKKKIFKSKHEWYVDKQITYGMIRKKLGYYYNINPNCIEIWLPQMNKWDYGTKGRGKWNGKLENLLSDGKDEWNKICTLKFEIQAYQMQDFDEMISYNEKINSSKRVKRILMTEINKVSKRIKELAMFNCKIIAPNKAKSVCGKMAFSFCKNWTTKNLVDNILKEVIENPIFGYTFFSTIVEYIRENEMDTQNNNNNKYIDDITILKSLTVHRFLLCDEDEKTNALPSEYYMDKQYKMPDSYSQIKYTDFRLQFLAKNDPLVLNRNCDGDNKMDIENDDNSDAKALWVYIHGFDSSEQKSVFKIRVVIANGQSLKDIIMKYLKPFLKIDYAIVESKNNNNNNEKINEDILFEQICKTHKFEIKGTENKWEKQEFENVNIINDIGPKMFLIIHQPSEPTPKKNKRVAKCGCICESLINSNENISLLWNYVSTTTKDVLAGAKCKYKTIGEIANATKQEIGQYIKLNKRKFHMANKQAWLKEYKEICDGLNGIVQSQK